MNLNVFFSAEAISLLFLSVFKQVARRSGRIFCFTGDIDVSFCNNSHHFSMIYAATMFRDLQATTSDSFRKLFH